MWVARTVLPQMYKQLGGHIINMCSVAGFAAPPLYSIYSAAKFGMRGFSEALRREAIHFGVKVSVIYPGGASTEFQSHMGTNEAKKRFKTPDWLKLTAKDVAHSVVGLAKRPRRKIVTPRWQTLSSFFNSHFSSVSDRVQSKAFAPFHQKQD
ncbi:MAG: SDR family NAD(P)-dependent oxidoreductase [Anaerolineales bacterium]